MASSEDPVVTSIANIMAAENVVIEKKEQIYYSLGLKSGNDFKKLELDSGNDSWKFFHGMMQLYSEFEPDNQTCIKKLVEVLKSLDLKSCAQKLSKKFPGHDGASNSEAISIDLLYNVEKKCKSPNFIGRIDELEKLKKLVFGAEDSSENCPTVLTSVSGMGGIGKTMLARKFVSIFREKYPAGNVAWVPCDTFKLAQDAFKEMGKELKIDVLQDQLPERVYDVLSKSHKKSLFIFDNLDDPEADWISDFLPDQYDNIYVLITSRRRDVLSKQETLDLNVFSKTDAVFLVKKYLPELSEELALKLSNELGCFPLALRIATSNISRIRSRSQNDATQDYLNSYCVKNEQIRKISAKIELDGYARNTYATIQMSLDQIESLKNGGEIKVLLALISFLDPDKIEEEKIRKYLVLVEQTHILKNLKTCIEILVKYSLITMEYFEFSERFYYQQHRLVQQAVQLNLTKEEKHSVLQILIGTFHFYRRLDLVKYLGDLRSVFKYLIKEYQPADVDGLRIKLIISVVVIASKIYYTHYDEDFNNGDDSITRNFVEKQLLNGSQNGIEFTTEYFNSLLKFARFDKVKKSFQNYLQKIYNEIPLDDPVILLVLFFRCMFPIGSPKEIKMFERICSLSVEDINAKLLPFEEAGLISRIYPDIQYLGIEHFFMRFFVSNLGNIKFPDSIVQMFRNLVVEPQLVAQDLVPLVILYFAEFSPNNLKILDYGTKWNLAHSIPNLTYGELYSMIPPLIFDMNLDLSMTVSFTVGVFDFKLLHHYTPITKDLIQKISLILSGKMDQLHTNPEVFNIIKLKLEQDMKKQHIDLDLFKNSAMLSYTAKCSRKCNIEYLLDLPTDFKEYLIKAGYCYKNKNNYFHATPFIACLITATATVEEQFSFYKLIIQKTLNSMYSEGERYKITWFMYYTKLWEQKHLEFNEDEFIFPLRLWYSKSHFNDFSKLRHHSEILNSVIEIMMNPIYSNSTKNPVVSKWKINLEKCFEIVETIDSSESFLEKLKKLFIHITGMKCEPVMENYYRENIVLHEVFHKFNFKYFNWCCLKL